MKCHKTDNDLLFYSGGSMTQDEKAVFESHLAECHDCRSRLSLLSEISIFIENEKKRVPNEFLFTRIMAGIESGMKPRNEIRKILVPVMVASFLIMIAIMGGVSIGKGLLTNHEEMNYIIGEENRSLNDLKLESIENFFLTSDNFKNE